MSKIAAYLAEHLKGEVVTGPHIRAHFATDGSILKITPLVVAFPFTTSDVRKIAHFSWQLAEKGHTLPITPRGSGSSRVGAAIGAGIVVSLPTHFDTIFEVDTKQKLVRLQPGVGVTSLQQAMQTHGLSWPVSATTSESTVGGAIGNNLYSEFGGKYGDTTDWIDQLEVVLANGDVIQTEALSKRALSKKKGLSTAEGEIYRKLDNLITDNAAVIEGLSQKPGTIGYNLSAVKDRKGNFNLAPLFVGSQGTLGVVTEAIIRLVPYSPQVEVLAIALTSLDGIETLVSAVGKAGPSRMEFIDKTSLNYAREQHSIGIAEFVDDDTDVGEVAGVLIIELNEAGRIKAKAKKLAKYMDKLGHYVVSSDGDYEAAQSLWQLYHRIEAVLVNGEGEHKSSLPIIEDALVAVDRVFEFLEAVQELSKKHRVTLLSWAHASTGVVHTQAVLSLKNLTDKQKVAKLQEDYYQLVVRSEGSVAGEYGEGRLRAKYAFDQFTADEKEILQEVKNIFDVHGIFNPGVKVLNDTDKDALIKLDDSFESNRYREALPRI